VRDLPYAYENGKPAGVSPDSYERVCSDGAHWLTRLPWDARVLSSLPVFAFGFGSSCSSEAKIGAGVFAAIVVLGLYQFFNRKITRRRVSELPSPIHILKYGVPRLRFPGKLDTAEKVIKHYMQRGFDEAAARKIAYAWFLQTRLDSNTVGNLNPNDPQSDLPERDPHGIAADFSKPTDCFFDNGLLKAMESVGCSRYLGAMFNALYKGIRVVPEIANIFLAMNLVAYHKGVKNPKSVYAGLQYILSKYGDRSSERYLIRDVDVQNMLKADSAIHVNDNQIVQGLTHLLCGSMALDAHEVGEYDEGLRLGFAHIWSARLAFEDFALHNSSVGKRESVRTVTEEYSEGLVDRAKRLWEKTFPDLSRPEEPWSSSMLPQTTMMLRHFSVKSA
jgi:hypothetical protein